MVSKSAVSPVITEDRVRAVAYSLWLEEGQPHGRAEAHWHRAWQLVNAESDVAPAPVKKTKTKAAAPVAARKAAPAKRAPAKKKSV